MRISGPSGAVDGFDEVAQISPDRFLSDLVRLVATCAEKSKVSLQVAAVSIQCVKTTARLRVRCGLFAISVAFIFR